MRGFGGIGVDLLINLEFIFVKKFKIIFMTKDKYDSPEAEHLNPSSPKFIQYYMLESNLLQTRIG